MRTLQLWPTVAALAFGAAGAAGCVSGEEPPVPLPEPGFLVPVDYPPSPFGVSVGDVISPFEFPGYPRPDSGAAVDELVTIRLADFYNPTGTDTYPPGSKLGEGLAKPLALLVNVGAVWCSPCQYEARYVMPGKYEELAPRGGEFLMNLAQSAAVGAPATETDLKNWIHVNKVTFPAVLDPKQRLGALFDTSSYPANIIVDTRTMRIVEILPGVPTESFWSKFAALLEP